MTQRVSTGFPAAIAKGDTVTDSTGRKFFVSGKPEKVLDFYSMTGFPVNQNGSYGAEKYFDLDPEKEITIRYVEQVEQYS